MQKLTINELKYKANDIRQDIIEMLLEAKSGHSAGPLDMADVFTVLYFAVLNHQPQNPKWDGRDYLILSCGHINPVLYASLAEAGYFPKEELKTLRKIHSRLQGHPHNLSLPGIETTSGPLAQGTSQALGFAYGLMMDHKKSQRVYLIMSDGEQQEGQVWEAVMFAGKYKLHNITAIIDRNNVQIDGYTEEIMPLENLRAKYEAFNWHVLEVDGHNIQEIIDACHEAKAIYEKPTVIIAHTIAGKGVDFMEYDYKWHGSPPNKEQAQLALKELRTLRGQIQSEHE
ncbi:MAG: transketolase [Candidatus Doudnabacteria bacterium]|nr:transketolase [Candidatus Doudnabacteria bacterium]